MCNPKQRLTPRTILLSYVVFLSVWSLRAFCLKTSAIGGVSGWLVGFVIHVICWPLFALILIRRYDADLAFPLREMLTTVPKAKVLLPALIAAAAYNGVSFLLDPQSYGTHMPLYDLIITILTVGFFEEIVFRGWFLNAVSVYTGERAANCISAALFSLVHFPNWVKAGLSFGMTVYAFAGLFFIGLFFGFVFRKSRSVWASAIVHSFWDMLTWIL